VLILGLGRLWSKRATRRRGASSSSVLRDVSASIDGCGAVLWRKTVTEQNKGASSSSSPVEFATRHPGTRPTRAGSTPHTTDLSSHAPGGLGVPTPNGVQTAAPPATPIAIAPATESVHAAAAAAAAATAAFWCSSRGEERRACADEWGRRRRRAVWRCSRYGRRRGRGGHAVCVCESEGRRDVAARTATAAAAEAAAAAGASAHDCCGGRRSGGTQGHSLTSVIRPAGACRKRPPPGRAA